MTLNELLEVLAVGNGKWVYIYYKNTSASFYVNWCLLNDETLMETCKNLLDKKVRRVNVHVGPLEIYLE